MSPRSPEQNEQIRAETRKRLLDAARSAFSELGFHNATMAEVARRAGVSKGLPYSHFDSKGALLEALAEERFLDQFSVWEESLSQGTARERLRFVVERTLHRANLEPDATRFYLNLLLQPDAIPHLLAAKQRLLEEAQRWHHNTLQLMTDLGSDDPENDLLTFSALLNGLLLTAVTTGAVPDLGVALDRAERMLSTSRREKENRE